MSKTMIRNAEGIVVLDKPIVSDSNMTIYAYVYTNNDDELICITSQDTLVDLQKELKKKLGRCAKPIRIDIDDTTSVRVLRFADFVKEKYSIQVANDDDTSQTCYDNSRSEEISDRKDTK